MRGKKRWDEEAQDYVPLDPPEPVLTPGIVVAVILLALAWAALFLNATGVWK